MPCAFSLVVFFWAQWQSFFAAGPTWNWTPARFLGLYLPAFCTQSSFVCGHHEPLNRDHNSALQIPAIDLCCSAHWLRLRFSHVVVLLNMNRYRETMYIYTYICNIVWRTVYVHVYVCVCAFLLVIIHFMLALLGGLVRNVCWTVGEATV